LIVLALLLVAVAATTIGLGIGANAPSEASVFGTADHLVTLVSTGAQLEADLAKLRSSFGTVDVIEHEKKIPVPSSANGIDLRAQDPNGAYGRTMLRLNQGRWPQVPDEIAVTDRVATVFRLHVGGIWDQGGKRRTVVGLVENPLNLHNAFALVAPGHVTALDHVDVLIRASQADFTSKPRPDDMSIQSRSDAGDMSSVVVLVLATIGLVFVGLLAVAGFTVMAQRRLRALGMLGAIGASHRHIRLVLLANGVVIGGVGALAGAIVGVAGWVALSPQLESLLGHRIDRLHLPWTPVFLAVGLATVTAVVAAWWPARAAARIPVVAALSARPAPPRPAHRFAALGALLLIVGLASLFLARQTKVPYILGGVLATAIALLLLAPVGVATIGRLARHAPLAARLAMRDLARYRSRSSAALAAIGLAVGIAAVVALSTAVTAAKAAAPTGGNLPADQIVVWFAAVAEHNVVAGVDCQPGHGAADVAGADESDDCRFGPDLEQVVSRAHDLGQGCGRAAQQVRQVRAAGLQVTAGDRGVRGGYEAGGRLIQAGFLQRVGVLFSRQVVVGHLRGGDLADDAG
jgi:putative ABC transport system permease protein